MFETVLKPNVWPVCGSQGSRFFFFSLRSSLDCLRLPGCRRELLLGCRGHAWFDVVVTPPLVYARSTTCVVSGCTPVLLQGCMSSLCRTSLSVVALVRRRTSLCRWCACFSCIVHARVWGLLAWRELASLVQGATGCCCQLTGVPDLCPRDKKIQLWP